MGRVRLESPRMGPNERVVLSVIARKIEAVRNREAPRADAEDTAQAILPVVRSTLGDWLGTADPEIVLKRAEWDFPPAEGLPGVVMICRGKKRDQRIAIAVSLPLAEMSAKMLLGLPSKMDDAAKAAFDGFVQSNILSLGELVTETDLLAQAGVEDALWTIEPADEVVEDFERCHGITFEAEFLDGVEQGLQIIVLMTERMILVPEEADESDGAASLRLPPRLGPCHVTVRAVADSVQMSVADCTRLSLDQVVALPGLRFDRLKLSVDMEDGPIVLTDAALGADKGVKAVRLNRGLDPAFKAPPEVAASADNPTGEAVPA